jgi:hypothetical protein
MRAVFGTLCLAVIASASGPGWTQELPAIDLKVVNYDELAQTIRRHRGNVVVVDLWGEF